MDCAREVLLIKRYLFSPNDRSTSSLTPLLRFQCSLVPEERGINPPPLGEGGAQRRVREVFDFSPALNRHKKSAVRKILTGYYSGSAPMAAVSVTSTGQVTIPKRVRLALGITPGS